MIRTWILALAVLTLPLLRDGFGFDHAADYWIKSRITAAMVRSQISNSKCVSSTEYLRSCRDAVRAAKEKIGRNDLTWPDDDFDTIIASIDQLPGQSPAKEVIFGAMLNAHLRAFDAHAFILPSEEFERWFRPGADNRNGIGIRYLVTDAGVFIRRVLPNSPASAAGLKPFDRIVRINGALVGSGLEASKNMNRLSGANGDIITVELEASGQYRETKVKIELVVFPELESGLVDFHGRRHAYIWLSRMKEGSCQLMNERLRKLLPQSEGLILDMRDNDGGLLDQAVCIAGLFIGHENVVGEKYIPSKIPEGVAYRADPSPQIRWQTGSEREMVMDLPLVVLVNANSASGTEILVGALQDHKKAWLVGERTYGKGSVQRVQPMIGHSDFRVGFTVAFYFRPSGTTTQLVGVTPDFEVPIRRSASSAERRFLHEHDFYPTSLPVTPLNERAASRREGWALRRCVEGSHLDLRAQQTLEHRGPEDYQEAYGLAVLECQLTQKSRIGDHI